MQRLHFAYGSVSGVGKHRGGVFVIDAQRNRYGIAERGSAVIERNEIHVDRSGLRESGGPGKDIAVQCRSARSVGHGKGNGVSIGIGCRQGIGHGLVHHAGDGARIGVDFLGSASYVVSPRSGNRAH